MFRLFFITILLSVLAPSGAQAQYLTIYHIDVGQGDATLFIAPNGTTLLVDGGDRGKGSADVGRVIKALGIDTLDYVVASHYHADHIGGLDEIFFLLKNIPVTVLDRGTVGPRAVPSTKQYKEYAEHLDPDRSPVMLGRGAIELGDGITVMVATANGCVYRRRSKPEKKNLDENATSVSLVVNYGTFDYFVGGDLTGGGRSGSRNTQDIEGLAAPVIGDVDVLQVNHHGSATSSNETFLNLLSPEVAVITAGNGGSNRSRYHHPRRVVLDRLHDLARNRSLDRIFMTRRGETDGGLLDRDMDIMTIVNGHIAIFATQSSYTVNGVVYRTDGLKSGAAGLGVDDNEECQIS